ncbi:MAG TPA: L-threonylcarbamoyladenylate synthase [Dehalococcoidia bacterium]|nr:L-threonylcarbamoyladenylate synthase [Dehalococcoidia bacterium]
MSGSENGDVARAGRIKQQYRDAIEAMRNGGVVALPTDTVYGLCAIATNSEAVRRLYQIKRRSLDQPLPVFVGSIEQARIVADLSAAAERLMQRFWPGALTIVLPKKPSYRTLAAAGSETIGVRQPADIVLCEVALQLGPITSTSANISGRPECRTADDVRAQLGDAVDVIVESPLPAAGAPSAVVDATDAAVVRVLREGEITARTLQEYLGDEVRVESGASP